MLCTVQTGPYIVTPCIEETTSLRSARGPASCLRMTMEGGSADIDDYEALPDTVSTSTHMLAGAMAGIMEHCIMYPIDCVKTRMQALNPCAAARYNGIFNALYVISAKEGLRHTLRGISAVVGGAGPAHALYFACYEKLKWMFSQTKQGTALNNATAGACATLFHDAVMVPADVIKQRMQVYNSPYRNVWDCMARVYKAEGVRAFYRSYTTQMAMNVPFQGIHFMVYELAQNRMNHDRHYDPFSHVMSGGIAGAAAAAITNPMDVCKTLLNTQEVCCKTGKPATMGLLEAARTIHRCHGMGGFYRGIQARVVFQVPSTAISWSVYEFFKYFLTVSATVDTASSTR